MVEITSRDNKTLKLIRSLRTKKGRNSSGLYFAEGKRMAEEAFAYAEDRIEAVLVSEEFFEKNSEFILCLDEKKKKVYTAKEKIFAEVCDTETPQGIGMVMRMPSDTTLPAEAKFLLVLDGVSEPGNLGTIIRTAEAAGVDGILLMQGCADLYNPKVVRSTMGSLFRMPCLSGLTPDDLKIYREKGYQVVATALRDSIPLGEAKPATKQILVIGSEAFGVSEEVLALADLRVRIPMAGQVESLNAAVAAGIAMYALR